MKKIGIYIHVPFCKSKCPYCDFYSLNCSNDFKQKYIDALKNEISSYNDISADTIYIGGGTPSVLSGDEIFDIIIKAKNQFGFTEGEVTVEANPSSLTDDFAQKAVKAGVNRFSLGVQSAVESERKMLGRKSSPNEILGKIKMLKTIGIKNISLDVMLGVPSQTLETVKSTLDFCINAEVQHISAYILKIENGTFFDNHKEKYDFPDEELTSQMYEFSSEYLRKNGFSHYEISNFSLEGFESRHNLKYWNCEEYIGFGPSAHSFLNGKRFFHQRDLSAYISAPLQYISDGGGGDFEEFAMLKLRLKSGLLESDVQKNYHKPIPDYVRKNAEPLVKNGLVFSDELGIYLTEKGFLVSNYVIGHLLF